MTLSPKLRESLQRCTYPIWGVWSWSRVIEDQNQQPQFWRLQISERSLLPLANECSSNRHCHQPTSSATGVRPFSEPSLFTKECLSSFRVSHGIPDLCKRHHHTWCWLPLATASAKASQASPQASGSNPVPSGRTVLGFCWVIARRIGS